MKTKQVTHTPTPWHRNVSPAWKYPIYADRNGDANGKDWIRIAAVLPDNPNAEEDLDFIIRAVNCHEKLVEAIRLLTKEIDLSKLNIRKDFSLINAHAYATKAIHKAEGK